MLDTSGHRAIASLSNLSELWRTPNPSERIAKVRAITTVCSQFEERPESYYHAWEFLKEVRFLRPKWLVRNPSIDHVADLLKAQRLYWVACRRDPAYMPQYSKDFVNVSERGISDVKIAHKNNRQSIVIPSRSGRDITFGHSRTEINSILSDLSPPEAFWRIDAAQSFRASIYHRVEYLRDYNDWAGPYIKREVFPSTDYDLFWVRDVKAARVRSLRLAGLIGFSQLGHKYGHGNAGDVLHAHHLLTCDIMITADKDFYSVVESTRKLMSIPAYCALVNRGSPNPTRELRNALQMASAAKRIRHA